MCDDYELVGGVVRNYRAYFSVWSNGKKERKISDAVLYNDWGYKLVLSVRNNWSDLH